MSTAYLQRVLNGEMPSTQEWQEHLIAFHASFPEAADHFFSRFHDDSGRTSYERLRDMLLVPIAKPAAILDIGVGSGGLLLALYERAADAALCGVDLSQEEIALAQARVPSAKLIVADAAALPFADHSFDLVASHLALMIMPNIAATFSEIRRVLRPGGRLGFVIDDPRHPLMSTLSAGVFRAVAADYPAFLPPPFSDMRIYEWRGVEEVLRRAGFEGAARHEAFVVSAVLDRDALWNFVERTYLVGMLEDPTRSRVRDEVLYAADEETLVRIPLRLTTIDV